jgi:hypothetical protein
MLLALGTLLRVCWHGCKIMVNQLLVLLRDAWIFLSDVGSMFWNRGLVLCVRGVNVLICRRECRHKAASTWIMPEGRKWEPWNCITSVKEARAIVSCVADAFQSHWHPTTADRGTSTKASVMSWLAHNLFSSPESLCTVGAVVLRLETILSVEDGLSRGCEDGSTTAKQEPWGVKERVSQYLASLNQQSTALNQNTNGAVSLCGGIISQLHQILQHRQRQQVNCIFSSALSWFWSLQRTL